MRYIVSCRVRQRPCRAFPYLLHERQHRAYSPHTTRPRRLERSSARHDTFERRAERDLPAVHGGASHRTGPDSGALPPDPGVHSGGHVAQREPTRIAPDGEVKRECEARVGPLGVRRSLGQAGVEPRVQGALDGRACVCGARRRCPVNEHEPVASPCRADRRRAPGRPQRRLDVGAVEVERHGRTVVGEAHGVAERNSPVSAAGGCRAGGCRGRGSSPRCRAAGPERAGAGGRCRPAPVDRERGPEWRR